MPTVSGSTPAPAFRVTAVPEDPRRVVVRPSGEIDMMTAGTLREAIDDALREYAPGEIVVDMSGVTFMDSSGINVLFHSQTHAARRGCGLFISDPPDVVRRVLRVTGVLHLLSTAPEVTAASTEVTADRPGTIGPAGPGDRPGPGDLTTSTHPAGPGDLTTSTHPAGPGDRPETGERPAAAS